MSRADSTRHPRRWVCAQLGSREHYAIPRVLHEGGRLDLLLTDYWARPGAAGRARRGAAAKVAQRFHPALRDAHVIDLGWRRIAFDLTARLLRRGSWPTTTARNAWFQRSLLRRLRPHAARLRERPGVFFAYSYAALGLLRFFRDLGWRTILGQIDPGPHEEALVVEEYARHPHIRSSYTRAPADYWRLWREECAASDLIAVNSPWSAEALARDTAVRPERIRVLPLAFEAPASATKREIPAVFTEQRPLRVLFLGQIVVRKGAHLALEAARRLAGRPVEWQFVGPAEFECPADLRDSPRVRWSGPVSRAATTQLYREADLFLLPTLSDGFALTQLEAQAAGLPVLASRFCGAVVRDGANGLLLDPLTPETIAAAVERCLESPALVARLAAGSGVEPVFSLAALADNLRGLEAELFPNDATPEA